MGSHEKHLEKIIKKIDKGEDVSADEFLLQWKEDQGLIRGLNKIGWNRFVQWGIRHPEVRRKLATLADQAGVTQEAAEVLRQAGIAVSDADTPRTRALEIAL